MSQRQTNFIPSYIGPEIQNGLASLFLPHMLNQNPELGRLLLAKQLQVQRHQELQRQLQQLRLQQNVKYSSLPPPAHNSPAKSHLHLLQHNNNDDNNNATTFPESISFWPVQTAPEDLRTTISHDEDLEESTGGTSDGGGSIGELPESIFRPMTSAIKRESVHECPECGKAYSTSSNLARHRQTHR